MLQEVSSLLLCIFDEMNSLLSEAKMFLFEMTVRFGNGKHGKKTIFAEQLEKIYWVESFWHGSVELHETWIFFSWPNRPHKLGNCIVEKSSNKCFILLYGNTITLTCLTMLLQNGFWASCAHGIWSWEFLGNPVLANQGLNIGVCSDPGFRPNIIIWERSQGPLNPTILMPY